LIVRRRTGAPKSEHTLEINAFAPKADIDELDMRDLSFPMARVASQ
jgi:non-homologous end joining protein Ku